MALIYNGKTLGPSATIKYAGVALQKIIYKNIEVWRKWVNTKAYIAGICYRVDGDGTRNYLYPSRGTDTTNSITSKTLNGNILSWYGDGACLKANCDCTVTVSGTITYTALENTVACVFTVGGITIIDTVISKYGTKSSFVVNKTINLKAGQTIAATCRGGNNATPWTSRIAYEGGLTFNAVPR